MFSSWRGRGGGRDWKEKVKERQEWENAKPYVMGNGRVRGTRIRHDDRVSEGRGKEKINQ